MTKKGALPIEAILPELSLMLGRARNAVLVAPPGAGKTTRVPLALVHDSWLAGQKIIMLEPRRLAARATAAFMAKSLGEKVGETVGYRVRMDAKIGPHTRIEVITEGILTRMLQRDPSLEGVGLVIFDEFHERSIHADLGLALSLESQSVLREDLRLLVMSATLEAEPVAKLMGDAPVVVSAGRQFPVETRFFPRASSEERLEQHAVRAVLNAVQKEKGNLLVFLPGAGEIRRVEARLREQLHGKGIEVSPLHGSLSQEAQDRALYGSISDGQRKIVLATSIAETSLTVEGVRVVVDCGLMRVPRFSPRTGMSRLETVPVTRASADQRRGRAGRVQPGVCYRLWSEEADRSFAAAGSPEIEETDLAPLALELSAWGVADPGGLRFLTPPPDAGYRQALELLEQLNAVTGSGQLTEHGRQMAESGLHPRLAHMVIEAVKLGLGEIACEAAALLEERDIVRTEPGVPASADFMLRMELLRAGMDGQYALRGYSVEAAVCRRIAAAAQQLKRLFRLGMEQQAVVREEECGLLLAYAYPDRIAMQRGGGRFLLRNGRGAELSSVQEISYAPFLVAAELDDQGADSRIRLAVRLHEEQLQRYFGGQIEEEHSVSWEASTQSVRARKRRKLGALVLEDTFESKAGEEDTAAALLEGIREEGLGILPWTKFARQLQQRLLFMHAVDPVWPDASDEGLLSGLEQWLGAHIYGMRSRSDLQRVNMGMVLESMLSYNQQRELEEIAPTHVTVPSGSRIPIDYSDAQSPVLSVRLQEMFGLERTPAIGRGRMPLTLHLLSPAQRPVQVTKDLTSFWNGAYFEVKKDLRGRYPKHYWPDNPLEAAPTNRTRPRGKA